MLIDSHAHLTAETVFDHIDDILFRAASAQIKAILNICTDPLTLKRGEALSLRFPWIFQSGATTPHDVEREGEAAFAVFAQAAREGRLCAIGETGLDYYNADSEKKIQKQFLRRYLHLALECRLPVVIHCREAFADFFEILDAEYQIHGRHAPGVLHCFTGTANEAEEVLKRGWKLSLSGIVTFKKSVELQKIATMIPLDQLLIETDTPYLAPQQHRGKMNEPAFLAETAQFIADLRQLPFSQIAQITTLNAINLFGLDEAAKKVG